jgi:hypothetical protein
MNPEVWGPSFWLILHTISINYASTGNPSYLEKRHHYDFFRNLQFVLPCTICRQHYTDFFKTYPIENFLESKKMLVKWVIMVHNQVNKRQHKPMLEYNEVIQLYQKIYARGSFCSPTCAEESSSTNNRWSTLQLSAATSGSFLIGAGIVAAGFLYYQHRTTTKN